MTKYFIGIEMPEGKLKEIMDRIDAAQNELFECYKELEALGVLTVKEKTVGKSTDGHSD